MHIVSNVVGDLADDKDMIDVLAAAFPAGTVSGAPKTRAMQIIEELEGRRRGLYAGCVGYLSFSGAKESAMGDLPMRGEDGLRFFTRQKEVTVRWPEPGRRATLSLVFPSNT